MEVASIPSDLEDKVNVPRDGGVDMHLEEEIVPEQSDMGEIVEKEVELSGEEVEVSDISKGHFRRLSRNRAQPGWLCDYKL